MELIKKIEATRHFGTEFLTWLLYHSIHNNGEVETKEGVVEVWFEDKVKLVSPLRSRKSACSREKTPPPAKKPWKH